MPRMSYSRRIVGLKRWDISRHCEELRDEAIQKKLREAGLLRRARNDGLSDLLFDLVRSRDAEARDHLAQFLAGGDVTEADLAQLLQVEQGQALREQFAVDDALAKARDDPEADALRKLVHRRADAL